jgi:transcriptional regulator of acetoin/glycerol metabolism
LRLSLPPLRERSDLSALIRRILEDKLGKHDVRIQPDVLELMQRHPWRGNIRQLANVLRSAVVFMQGQELAMHHLPEDFLDEMRGTEAVHDSQPGHGQPGHNVGDIASAEAALIKYALNLHGGNMAAAARHLGISRATVYRKAKRLQLL